MSHAVREEDMLETTVADHDDEPTAAETGASAGKRKMKPRTKLALIAIGLLALIAAAVMAFRMITDAATYVTTDNAQIDGTQIVVAAPASGTLQNWTGTLGSQLTADRAVGRIAVQSGYAQPQTVVRAPASGVVAVNNGVNGTFVPAGAQLAVAYDPSKVYVTARVDETEIGDVHEGKEVEIHVDAFGDKALKGHVTEIKTGAAGVFSLFPQSNSTGNFQKVTQVIPVQVSIDDAQGLALVPGMNVTVRIHKQ